VSEPWSQVAAPNFGSGGQKYSAPLPIVQGRPLSGGDKNKSQFGYCWASFNTEGDRYAHCDDIFGPARGTYRSPGRGCGPEQVWKQMQRQ